MTNDMTAGKPSKLIISFSVPLLIGNIFQQLYSMADTIIVGRTIGVHALAAVGATGAISFLILGFVQGITAGFAVITAQRFGANDPDAVRKSAAACALLSAAVTVVVTLVSVAAARPLLELMNTPPDIIEDSYRYIVVIFGGIAASVFYNMLSSIVRALGDSRTPLLFLIIASLLNILLDFVFILNFNMGVAGAAWATVAAQVVAGILCLLYIARNVPAIWIRRGDWRPDGRFLWKHLRVGLPMAFQFSITAIGVMMIQGALNAFGSDAVAAFTAASKIDSLATQPLNSIGVTMATYCAQNYGAGQLSRVRSGIRSSLWISFICCGIGAVVCLALGAPLTRLFVGGASANVLEMSMIYLFCNAPLYVLLAVLFVFRNSLQGMGYGLVPMMAGVVELVMRCLAAVFLAEKFQYTGVCMANPVAWLGAAVLLTVEYLVIQRKWTDLKKKQPS